MIRHSGSGRFQVLVSSFRQRQYLHFRRSSSTSAVMPMPFNDVHRKLGAEAIPSSNDSMPAGYLHQSHSESHKWTRSHASLFDVSDMVQHTISGPLAEEFLMTITPGEINKLTKHSSILSCLLSLEGGMVDDVVVTRLGNASFYLVTNSRCHDSDLSFLRSQLSRFISSKCATKNAVDWNVLENYSLLSIQGPLSSAILESMIFSDGDDPEPDSSLSTLYFGHSRWLQLHLRMEGFTTPSLLVSRTGYTGEDGFEISIPPERGPGTALVTSIANAITSDPQACRWASLRVKDSLRLEAGLCLYGHDIDPVTTPPQAGLSWMIPEDRRLDHSPAFNGRELIISQLSRPDTISAQLVGLVVEPGLAAREGAQIVDLDDPQEVIGNVTSGGPSPSLGGVNIAMGMVSLGWNIKGIKVRIKFRGETRVAEVVDMPFVENSLYLGGEGNAFMGAVGKLESKENARQTYDFVVGFQSFTPRLEIWGGRGGGTNREA
ncbi:glycine cleavage system T protein [Exophiala oligosperma]|uniref:Glycine cleavage system T protein n=1 Tax=Exophiala oligosperma TaxID=215243 RepID=A0A0D2A8P7_9EURO|nr:glycine cleavage system T protein [Exophiala oligosperma]KIW36696.1 glycine cleavage system T protein [Exophiala oligosperma]